MGLFKNEVGRPSNEILKKRKIAYLIIAIVIVSVLGSGIFLITKYFSNDDISGKSKNAAVATCTMPYNMYNCQLAKSDAVKSIQSMLKKKGYYKGALDGNFSAATATAVKHFQQGNGLKGDSHVGPDTMRKLATASGTEYYEITYNANGGTGSLNYKNGFYTGAWNNKQIIIKGVSTPLSIGNYTLTGYKHVGFVDGSNKFYNFGQKVSSFSSKNVTLYAVYCRTNESYVNGKCVGSHKITIKYNTYGGTVTKNTTSNGSKYAWTSDSSGNISVSINGSKATDALQTKVTPSKVNLYNYNNSTYLNITKAGYVAKSGAQWYCYSGSCKGKTFDHNKDYDISDLCNISSGDCTISLRVNWVPKTIKVIFHKNTSTSDTATVNQTFTYGVANQKFGYNNDGKAKWAQTGQFGQWDYSGYKLLGWSLSKTAKEKTYDVYSGVAGTWIDKYSPEVNLYAVWAKAQANSNSVTIKYEKNGAVTIGKVIENCGSSSCSVKMPSITADNNFDALGWSTSPTATVEEYKVGENVKITKNTTLYAITKSKYPYSAFFNYNKSYVSNITDDTKECYRFNGSDSCTVNVPTVTVKNGYTYEGWSTDNGGPNTASNLFTKTIKISSMINELYLVLSKNVAVSFNKNNADSINISSANCKYYVIGNNVEGCKIESSKIPRIYSAGNVVNGFSLSTTGGVTYISTTKIKENSTFYAKLGESNRKISVSKTEKVSGVPFDVENSNELKSATINKMISNIKTASSNMPYLFDARTKVRLISKKTYQNKLWDEKSAGMAYGYNEYRNIDVSVPYEYNEYYTGAIIHELGHAWDSWYYISTGKYLHDQSDIVALYNEYNNKSAANRPLRNYSYTNTREFVAEMTEYYYYYKYRSSETNPNGGNAINRFDNRLVKVFEKYANIAKNGYK